MMNLQEFYTGKAFDTYDYFGAHVIPEGVIFRTYAPNARQVLVMGDFSDWRGEAMVREGQSGVYTAVFKNAKAGMLYKYLIEGQDGVMREHSDPYSFGMELRPKNASIIVDLSTYSFQDDKWMAEREKNYNQPLNIYELHLGSWRKNKKDENGWFTYQEIADELIAYVKERNYTHIEFLPLSEHPADCSWGYQNTGFFSPTSRYGTAQGLMELIDKCHQNNIGVILDFVPVHFAIDDYGMAKYDGSYLYEYPPSDVGVSEWGTLNFNFSRGETRSMLQSAACYWLDQYHIDGIRMDAISRAIYWVGDPNRGVNQGSVEFIQGMNYGLHKRFPTAMLIAEDSTDYVKVTAAVEYGGLGFDYKWDMGWMNDTLAYFKTPPAERSHHYHKLTFSMMYFFKELYLLPLSHDEVVHGKATIIQKMWGDDYEAKFSQCRAFYMYMFTHPGKKLNFMGNEIAQFREWDENKEQDWDLLKYPAHDSFQEYITYLQKLYLEVPALYQEDYDERRFKWIEVNGEKDSVYIYQRGEGKGSLVAAFNFSDQDITDYPFPSGPMDLKEILNSDWDTYGGKTPREPAEGQMKGIELNGFSGRMFSVV